MYRILDFNFTVIETIKILLVFSIIAKLFLIWLNTVLMFY